MCKLKSTEFVTGIRIKYILLDNGNWWRLFLKYYNLIRISIIINILKLLVCQTSLLGYHYYICPECKKGIKVPHTCKSRFCSSCSKKATDNWIKTNFNIPPHTIWQHITFTMPQKLWSFFWLNRYLMNKIPSIAAGIIQELTKPYRFIPGIFLVIHTFGRDLKRNIHIHLSTTIGGLSTPLDSWIKGHYFYHLTLKNMWRYRITALLRDEFKKGKLKPPPSLKHVQSYETFASWTSQFYNDTWVVHLNKQSDNLKANVEYLGKYLKPPPIGETRIIAYNGPAVTYKYLDHYSDTTEVITLPVLEFILRLISHIPDKNFRNIRYYGFLSNKLRGGLLPIVYKLLDMKKSATKKVYTTCRDMIKATYNYDPLQCPFCKITMVLQKIVSPPKYSLISMHEEIANGHLQPLRC